MLLLNYKTRRQPFFSSSITLGLDHGSAHEQEGHIAGVDRETQNDYT
jgi:hypothetical protein